MFSNVTGNENTALGAQALNKNIGGDGNTSVGRLSMYENTTGAGNVALGFEALKANTTASSNTALGYRAMHENTTGSYNLAAGVLALRYNQDGVGNVAVGPVALETNVSGDKNTAVGVQALWKSTGDGNTAVGHEAAYRTSTGSNSTALGRDALHENTTGSENAAVGYEAMRSATTATGNSGVGHRALFANLTGGYNTAVGRNAGSNFTAGNANTYIGNFSQASGGGTYDWSMALGESATVNATDIIRIGTNFTTSIGGYQLWSNVSDGRYKRDVQENVHGLDLIMKLRPVTYKLDHAALIHDMYDDPEFAAERMAQIPERARNTSESGFIAQEVDAAARELGYEFSGVDAPKNSNDRYGLRYAAFVVPLVKAVQEQQAMISNLESTVLELQHQLRALSGSTDH